jgi:DNA-directed RNA polymerase specialized sigma24 family protein
MNNLKSWYRHNRHHILIAQVEKAADLGSDIAVRDAIARLPLAERTAATAVWILGLDLDTAANITGLKPVTLRSRLSRARTRLNRWLKED